jgi:excisionase family DNA binding protein
LLLRSKTTPSSAVLTLAALQAELGLSRPTVAKLLRDGRIASFKIGRRVLVSRSALDRFIRTAERGA